MPSTADMSARRDWNVDEEGESKVGLNERKEITLFAVNSRGPAKTRLSGLDAAKTHTRPNNHMIVVPDSDSLAQAGSGDPFNHTAHDVDDHSSKHAQHAIR